MKVTKLFSNVFLRAVLLIALAAMIGCSIGGGGSGGGGGDNGDGTPSSTPQSAAVYTSAAQAGKLIWGFGVTEADAAAQAKAAYQPATNHWYVVRYTKTNAIVDKGKITVNNDQTITCTSSMTTSLTYKLTGWDGAKYTGVEAVEGTVSFNGITPLAPVVNGKITPGSAASAVSVLTGGGLTANDTLDLSGVSGGVVTLSGAVTLSGGVISGGTISAANMVTISENTTLRGTTLNVNGGLPLTIDSPATLKVGSGSVVAFSNEAKFAGGGDIVVENGGKLMDNNASSGGVWNNATTGGIVINYGGKAYNPGGSGIAVYSIGAKTAGAEPGTEGYPFRLILEDGSSVVLKRNGYTIRGTVTISLLPSSVANLYWFSLNAGDTLTGTPGAVIKVPAGAKLGFATTQLGDYITNHSSFTFVTDGDKSFIPTTNAMKLTWVPASGKWTLGTDT